jgi:hypothetical protein
VLIFDGQARLLAKDGNQNEIVTLVRYEPNHWYDIALRFDQARGVFDVTVDGQRLLAGAEFLDPVDSLERISFRTGEFRSSPTTRDPKSPGEDFPNADKSLPEAIFFIDDVSVRD